MAHRSWDVLLHNYADALNKLQQRTKLSWYRLSEVSHVDRAQLSRLKSGQTTVAGIEVTLRIGHGAMTSPNATLFDVAEFYMEVGLPSILPRLDDPRDEDECDDTDAMGPSTPGG